jgi:hypothetical protein
MIPRTSRSRAVATFPDEESSAALEEDGRRSLAELPPGGPLRVELPARAIDRTRYRTPGGFM